MPEIPPQDCRTGLLIPVAADGLVAEFRSRFNAATVARRLPPHITVLYPFARVAALDEGLSSELVTHFAGFTAFEAELTGVGQFVDFVWLAPSPRDRFVELIAATCERFPAYPPYEGEGGEPEPHLTIAKIDEGDRAETIADIARTELGPSLPFSFPVSGVSLFEEQGDGTFRETTQFQLG